MFTALDLTSNVQEPEFLMNFVKVVVFFFLIRKEMHIPLVEKLEIIETSIKQVKISVIQVLSYIYYISYSKFLKICSSLFTKM